MAGPRGTYFEGKNTRADRKNVLIVEGMDDAYFFDVLLSRLHADPALVGIVFTEGKDNLDAELAAFVKSPAFVSGTIVRYAVFRDADDDPNTAITDVHAVLTKHGQPNPPAGTLVSASSPPREVGLFIIPSPTDTGDLEKLCLSTVTGTPLKQHVDTFFQTVTNDLWPLDFEWKRKAQIFLAARQGDLCRGAGRGLVNGHFDASHASLGAIVTFLGNLIT